MILLTLVAISFNYAKASSARLSSMGVPVWGLRDDSESIDLSPALITRLNSSILLVDADFSYNCGIQSNTSVHLSTNSFDINKNSYLSINSRTAYLSLNSGFGYGIIFNPNFTIRGEETIKSYYNNPLIEDNLISAFGVNPADLSLLLGIKLGDSFSIAIKPRILYTLNVFSENNKTNDILVETNIGAGDFVAWGMDTGLNFAFGKNLIGLFGGFIFCPLHYVERGSEQTIDINAGLIGEMGALKGIAKVSYNLSTKDNPSINSIFLDKTYSVNPIFGIAYSDKILDSIILALGIKLSLIFTESESYFVLFNTPIDYDNISSNHNFDLDIECFAGFEGKFNEFITGRFGMVFSAFSWSSSESTSKYTDADHPMSPYLSSDLIYSAEILNNWRLSSGLTIQPTKTFTIDLLWSMAPFISGGWNVYNWQHASGPDRTTTEARDNLDISLSAAITVKM
jgi:hypothetical protein